MLRYDSSTRQLRAIIDDIEDMLRNHEKVRDDMLRARFKEFGDDAILVRIQCYVDCENFGEFLEIAQELNFHVMEIVEGQGASFALPGRMIYGTHEIQSGKD